MTESLPIRIATFNLHAGVDGWGRPFDFIEACRELSSDVLILEECWSSDHLPSMAEEVAKELGYELREVVNATGRRALPHQNATGRWMRPLDWRGTSHALYLDLHKTLPERILKSPRFLDAESGSWGIAVLSKFPIMDHTVIDLGRLSKDRAERHALSVTLTLSERKMPPLRVIGVHMSHIIYGSPKQYRKLSKALRLHLGDQDAVLGGDMNMWGPPASLLLGKRWRRLARGRTWPAWRPHSQADHLFGTRGIQAKNGGPQPIFGSDHLPLRAEIVGPSSVGRPTN